jgi:hypothetical protein
MNAADILQQSVFIGQRGMPRENHNPTRSHLLVSNFDLIPRNEIIKL